MYPSPGEPPDVLAAYTYALDIEADMERKRRLHDWDGAWWFDYAFGFWHAE
jgi:hypothetical protein